MNKRIAIIGNSGSGKSTLANALARQGAHAILDLDTIAWQRENPTELRPHSEAAADVRDICDAHEHWIVEGCYANLIEETLTYKPELMFLDPGLERCISNCRNRPWEPHKYASKSAQDENLAFLIRWVEDYYARGGELSFQSHLSLFDRYPGPKRRLTSCDQQHPNVL